MGIFTEWHYFPHPEPVADADVIIGMAFGANEKGSGAPPGRSNEAIAENIKKLCSIRRLPVIAQREVAEALAQLPDPLRPALVISESEGQFHISSREVLLQAWNWCRERSLSRAVLVAHPAHILRCAWVAQKTGFVVTLPPLSHIPYEPGSTQWWTRNRFFFFFWELRARIGWKIKGYL